MEESNIMNDNEKIIRTLIVCGLFAVFMFTCILWGHFRENNYQFAGVIQKLTYNEKRKVKVVVDGKSYGLGTSGDFNFKLEIGDSLIKQKDSMTYMLIKNKTGEKIVGKSWN